MKESGVLSYFCNFFFFFETYKDYICILFAYFAFSVTGEVERRAGSFPDSVPVSGTSGQIRSGTGRKVSALYPLLAGCQECRTTVL